MISSPERLTHINPAREAVADAMMAAQAYQYDLDVNLEKFSAAVQKWENSNSRQS